MTDVKNTACICPIVLITVTDDSHVPVAYMSKIADELFASVSREGKDGIGPAVYGKHRPDCPCGPKSDVK